MVVTREEIDYLREIVKDGINWVRYLARDAYDQLWGFGNGAVRKEGNPPYRWLGSPSVHLSKGERMFLYVRWGDVEPLKVKDIFDAYEAQQAADKEKEQILIPVVGHVRRIDDLGRIVIPKEMREILRVAEGDALNITLRGDGIHLTKAESSSDLSEEVCKLADQFALFENERLDGYKQIMTQFEQLRTNLRAREKKQRQEGKRI